MGDVLGGIFGSGGKQTTDNTIDPQSLEANKLRVAELQNYFSVSPYNSFAGPKADIYTGAPAVDALFSSAQQGADRSNLMSFDDYLKLGLDEGSNYINQVAKPEIMQTAALQGLDRGGFVADAVARATAGIALPFLQTLPGASETLTLAGPKADVLGAQRATSLFPLADYSRGLKEADLTRQQGLATAALTGIPFTPVTDSTAKKSSQPLFNFFGQG